MKTEVIAVLDVGKTNKKVIIYTLDLKIMDKVSKAFDEVVDSSGLKYEQPEEVFDWFVEQLALLASKYDIIAVSVTTHGAFGVCLDDNGNITCPPIAYTNSPGGDFSDSFYDNYGTRGQLQKQTATAEIGDMVNFAKMVHFWKLNNPEQFDATKHILMYPQYFGYKLTGIAGGEPTMLGCHTYLYDHKNNNYSELAEAMGLSGKLPESIHNSWEVLGKVTPELATKMSLNKDCIVTYGVHDSNSSLLPFLITEKKDFVLNSTGTWCVVMKKADSVEFADEEIGKTVFYNQDVFKSPVKTSIFMGGLEYETYMKLLNKLHNRKDLPEIDTALYNKVLDDCSCYILPSIVKGAGLFPELQACIVENGENISYDRYCDDPSIVEFFHDYDFAVAVLICSLVIQTSCALDAAGYTTGDEILVEGGFRKNKPYLELLSVLYPQSNIFTTNIEEATALGAAILGVSALQGNSPMDVNIQLEIEKNAVDVPTEINRIEKYRHGFLDLVQTESRVS